MLRGPLFYDLMTDSQWKRVLELYDSAENLPADTALTLLNSSAEDPEVVRQVIAMLASVDDGESGASPDIEGPRR